MKLSDSRINKTFVLNIVGDVDHHSTEEIKRYIYNNIGMMSKHLIINLSEVNFMDSSGIGMILGRYKEMVEKNGSVSIVGIKGNMERIYKLSGLYKIIKNYNTLEEGIIDIEGGTNE